MPITAPLSGNSTPLLALSITGPHAAAPAQSVDGNAIYTFAVPIGVVVRIACSSDLYVRTGTKAANVPADAAHLRQGGYVKAGAALVMRSLGLIWVTQASGAAALTWAPDVLVGTETDGS